MIIKNSDLNVPYLFSFKNVFWEKYVADDHFGYRIDVFKSTM